LNQSDWETAEEVFRRSIGDWATWRLEHIAWRERAGEDLLKEHIEAREIFKTTSSPEHFQMVFRRYLLNDSVVCRAALELKSKSASYKDPREMIRRTIAQWTRTSGKWTSSGIVDTSGFEYVLTADDNRTWLPSRGALEPRLRAYMGGMTDHVYSPLYPDGLPFVSTAAVYYAIYHVWNPKSLIVIPDSNDRLLRQIADDQNNYAIVTPRRFEEIIAYLYSCLGCRVKLTKQTRDWGADILTWHPAPFGQELLLVIQVKLYHPGRRVGLKELHELYGAISYYSAHSGHLVTTSDFTKPAHIFGKSAGIHLVNYKKMKEAIDNLFGSSHSIGDKPA
jgi:HJR/Mrr/RecB family endonuclease